MEPLPRSGPRVVISTLRNRMRRNDLIKRLIARDHPQIAPGALFQRSHPRFQVADFRGELSVALGQLVIFAPLRRDCRFETTQLADAIS